MARKILLADDSVTAQNMGRKILADAGYEVLTVNNGSAALKRVNEQRPDLIVLDVYMPGYSGLEVCQRLKEVGDTAGIPILLTVGKLEPFKPDEARRVRADGFIVKPFEASELLSALSKLEDKIVPRAESVKQGRFARAASVQEDSRFDKTVAIEEDTGWKDRIAFPSKKKKAEVEETDDAQAAASKDARVGKEATAPKSEPKPEERVDLGALAAAGLPKDVTPEEIAALAAAAAAVKSLTEERVATQRVEPAPPEPQVPIEADVPAASTSISPAVPEQKAQEAAEPKATEDAKAPNAEPAVQVPEGQHSAAAKNSDLRSATWEQLDVEASPEPVTMAMAAAAGAESATASRWTAVAVSLSPDEAALSLDQEMQKAYAAFAAAESGPAATMSAVPAAMPGSDTLAAVPAAIALVEVQNLNTATEDASDAVRAAVEELGNVAASFATGNGSTSQAAAAAVPAAENPVKTFEVVSPVEASAQNKTPVDALIAEVKSADPVPVPVQDYAAASRAEETFVAAPATDASDTASKSASNPANEVPVAAASVDPQNSGNSTEGTADIAAMAAAMAAAAGAGQPREEASDSAEADPAIASIVDSVLAGLRPKIVEEISKKLGKKK